jgi:hypothetical protein
MVVGWVEFDRSADGAQTWGDAELAFCFDTVGGGWAGAGHSSIEIESWTIEPGSAGPKTFYASGEETDSFPRDQGNLRLHPRGHRDYHGAWPLQHQRDPRRHRTGRRLPDSGRAPDAK